MKVRVAYTVEISEESLKAIEAYSKERQTRKSLKAILQQVGEMGLEEQVFQGGIILDTKICE